MRLGVRKAMRGRAFGKSNVYALTDRRLVRLCTIVGHDYPGAMIAMRTEGKRGEASRQSVLRVVSVASRSGAYGGPFDTARRQSLLMRRVGYQYTLLAGALKDDAPNDEAFVLSVPVKRLWPLTRGFSAVFSFRLLQALIKHLRVRPILHVSFARELTPFAAVAVARFFRAQIIVQPHGMLTSRDSLLHRVVDTLLTRPLLGKKTTLIALTREEKRQLLRWNSRLAADRVSVIGNPPPPSESLPARNDVLTKRALFAARLHPRKRVIDFAEAAAIAHSQGWGETYEVLGPDEGDLEKVLSLADALPNLSYTGATDSDGVLAKLAHTSVFVLCSRNEPWGNVLVASLMMGVPVVVTKSSVLAAEIHDSGAGLVVEDESPEAIARAVHRIASGPRANEFAQNAEIFAKERFSERVVVNSLVSVYTQASVRS